MKLAFFTSCLPNVPLEELVRFASEHGYKGLEVGCWPRENDRDFSASSIDVGHLDDAEIERLGTLFRMNEVEISSLAYYENNLHHDLSLRRYYHEHLYRVIDAAHMLGVQLVGTFVGRDITKSIHDNMEEYARVFPKIVQYAADQNVKLMIENCPMEGWHPDGIPGQIAYSPEIFTQMFAIIDSPNFGINFDPSHLYWLGIDANEMAREFSDKIFQAHAKDTEILADRNRYGIFGKQLNRSSEWDQGWWRYRIPGLGEISWKEFISTLYDIGYDGVLSVEHEDPVFSGSRENVERGLILAEHHLSPLLV